MCNNIHMNSKYEVSFIVPSFNEELNVKLLFDRINEVFKDVIFDVVYIDDGSKDNTFAEIKKISQEHNNIKAVSFSRNFGKEAALYAGLERADGEYVCIIDADMQQDPQVSLEMVNILKHNNDIDCVCAVPANRKDNVIMSFIKGTFYKVINKLSEVEFEKNASDFRTFRSSVKDALVSLKEKNRFTKGLFSWIGFKTTYIEYDVKPRATGTTKWSFKKLLKYAINGIISFSTALLKIPLLCGMILLFVSLIFIVIKIFNPLFLNSINSNSTLIVIMFIVCLFLFSFGIIGLYLADIYKQVKNRAIYIAKEEIK